MVIFFLTCMWTVKLTAIFTASVNSCSMLWTEGAATVLLGLGLCPAVWVLGQEWPGPWPCPEGRNHGFSLCFYDPTFPCLLPNPRLYPPPTPKRNCVFFFGTMGLCCLIFSPLYVPIPGRCRPRFAPGDRLFLSSWSGLVRGGGHSFGGSNPPASPQPVFTDVPTLK